LAIAPGSEGDRAARQTRISGAALEMAITNAVRSSDPVRGDFVGIILERMVPASRAGANWNIKGINRMFSADANSPSASDLNRAVRKAAVLPR